MCRALAISSIMLLQSVVIPETFYVRSLKIFQLVAE